MLKENLIFIMILMILFIFLNETIETFYMKKINQDLERNKDICKNPNFYDCQSIISIKDICNYYLYQTRLSGCEFNASNHE